MWKETVVDNKGLSEFDPNNKFSDSKIQLSFVHKTHFKNLYGDLLVVFRSIYTDFFLI